ncbi:MAG: GNAT family N-acetyltransferase [Patescibacteria group bacterium]|jgi:ribosomal-protein-alanine N-acetyltransferase
MNLFNYKIDSATAENIEEHLTMCSDMFFPPLATYVNIHDYSIKLRKYAVTFEAWNNNKLVGLLACYLNNDKSYLGFISNVSVFKKFTGKGVADQLLKNTIQFALSKKYKYLELEVRHDNSPAIKLYQKNKFVIENRVDDKYKMKRQLVD